MAAAINDSTEKRYAVVTGANKGIGFEICRQLASHGIVVVLTARDEKRGLDALEKLKGSGNFSDNLLFHQLDVADSSSVASLAEFIKTQFGKLDILVNNAGIVGLMFEGDLLLLKQLIDEDAMRTSVYTVEEDIQMKASGALIETHELAEQCLQTNYYGAKCLVEACLPLLQLSPSPRIVNVSSFLGKLELLSNEWAKGVLSDAESLTEERIDAVLNEFLKDFKDGTVQAKGWPTNFTAYKVSKEAMNAYTRVLAKKYPSFCVNSVCPGFTKTDMNASTGFLTPAEGAESAVRLALLDSPSGLFFFRKELTSF